MVPDAAHATLRSRLAASFTTGIVKGLKAAAWLLAIMVPISFAVRLLYWSGALQAAARFLAPAFGYLGLPAESAVSIVSSILLNIYSCIAAMEPLGLDDRQATVIALMALIAHNFPVEVAVQKKAGSSAVFMILLRLLSAAAAGFFLNTVLPPSTALVAIESQAPPASFGALMQEWSLNTGILMAQIIGIVAGLMILQRILVEFHLVERVTWIFRPLLWLMGLPRRTAFLWIVANTLGLAYGAAVIVDESRSGNLTRDDVRLLNISIAVCHSLLEDTLLFAAVGCWVFWITVPRLVLAAAAVWGYRACRLLLSSGKTTAPAALTAADSAPPQARSEALSLSQGDHIAVPQGQSDPQKTPVQNPDARDPSA
ncbi:MAG: nucleoside recognition domain-containing protein [Planctomycetes bacterium]|nr:nucleoside recognition domain-containing protein [Planctomycetota bacterium]